MRLSLPSAKIVTLQQILISQILFICHSYCFPPLYFSLSCVEELLFLFYNLLKPYIQSVFVCSRDPTAFIWFVMDWLILLIVHGTPSNYLQIHNSKASVFFLSLLSVQLSQLLEIYCSKYSEFRCIEISLFFIILTSHCFLLGFIFFQNL